MWRSSLLSLILAATLATAVWPHDAPPQVPAPFPLVAAPASLPESSAPAEVSTSGSRPVLPAPAVGHSEASAPSRVIPVQPTPRPGPEQVPVLLYHHLLPGASDENGAIIAVEEFEAQMAWLKARGYTGITTADLSAWLTGNGDLPDRPVLITFDDGYRSNYLSGFPILRSYGLKATLFVVSGQAGKRSGDLEHVSWREMLEMERAGVIELQAHTHNGHHEIQGVPVLKSWTGSEIKADLNALQQAFTEAGLKRPIAFAYPYGAYDAETLQALTDEGLKLGFTVEHGYVRPGDPPMELKRLIIYPGTSICRFGELVTGGSTGTCGT